MEPPNWDEPVPLSDVAPFGQPFGLSQGWLPTALPEVPPLIEPPVAGPLPLTAPALSPPIAEVPVPLNVVGPPAVPLAPPACANAKVPDSAKADASRIVAGFMTVSFLLRRRQTARAECNAMLIRRTLGGYGAIASSVYAKTAANTARTSNIEPTSVHGIMKGPAHDVSS